MRYTSRQSSSSSSSSSHRRICISREWGISDDRLIGTMEDCHGCLRRWVDQKDFVQLSEENAGESCVASRCAALLPQRTSGPIQRSSGRYSPVRPRGSTSCTTRHILPTLFHLTSVCCGLWNFQSSADVWEQWKWNFKTNVSGLNSWMKPSWTVFKQLNIAGKTVVDFLLESRPMLKTVKRFDRNLLLLKCFFFIDQPRTCMKHVRRCLHTVT